MADVLKQCKLRGCGKPQRSVGYCSSHYHSRVFRKTRPLYSVWMNMKRRCLEPANSHYPDYGGRGIKICESWLSSYYAFEADMGDRPTPFHQLDRINNDGDYEPGNCRWTTATVQARNRRRKINNTSGFTGVYWNKRQQKWHATITVYKHRIHLGFHTDLEDALRARARAEGLYF